MLIYLDQNELKETASLFNKKTFMKKTFSCWNTIIAINILELNMVFEIIFDPFYVKV